MTNAVDLPDHELDLSQLFSDVTRTLSGFKTLFKPPSSNIQSDSSLSQSFSNNLCFKTCGMEDLQIAAQVLHRFKSNCPSTPFSHPFRSLSMKTAIFSMLFRRLLKLRRYHLTTIVFRMHASCSHMSYSPAGHNSGDNVSLLHAYLTQSVWWKVLTLRETCYGEKNLSASTDTITKFFFFQVSAQRQTSPFLVGASLVECSSFPFFFFSTDLSVSF